MLVKESLKEQGLPIDLLGRVAAAFFFRDSLDDDAAAVTKEKKSWEMCVRHQINESDYSIYLQNGLTFLCT
jgi:hypothetical protein